MTMGMGLRFGDWVGYGDGDRDGDGIGGEHGAAERDGGGNVVGDGPGWVGNGAGSGDGDRAWDVHHQCIHPYRISSSYIPIVYPYRNIGYAVALWHVLLRCTQLEWLSRSMLQDRQASGHQPHQVSAPSNRVFYEAAPVQISDPCLKSMRRVIRPELHRDIHVSVYARTCSSLDVSGLTPHGASSPGTLGGWGSAKGCFP
eukprot:12093271-Karenia_brevis.AAC.1